MYSLKELYRSQRLFVLVIISIAVSGCNSNNSSTSVDSQSVARQWNEVLLRAIRNDYARPTVHARNLFHVSAAMYDAWAVYSDNANTYFLGKNLQNSSCILSSFPETNDIQNRREKAISYAAYRLIRHRFAYSPNASVIFGESSRLMNRLGFDVNNESLDVSNGSAAAMGNYIASCYINYGLQDGSNEVNHYENISYQPINPVIEPALPGNPNIIDLNRWQAISLPVYIDQAGNPINSEPEFLSPEWGGVTPFALTETDRTTFVRNNFDYPVYFDPGPPPFLGGELDEEYKWNFALVSIWSSHLDTTDGVTIDISPANIGNTQSFPDNFNSYSDFYNLMEGGDTSTGHTMNPSTGNAYEPQIVPRGDYARVLAEFWADGPDSETPPGHWFVIVNAVNDHPDQKHKFMGVGDEFDNLEWDVKIYFALGGAMHDAAIAAWGIKGWYDYIRPVSAIRAMADLGQSSEPSQASYNVNGIPLYPGYIERVESGDPLTGASDVNVGKIKLYAWRGPDYIDNPEADKAGVGWILAENWWPYQRPSFVTPPFAGYVSGHSTYSRAAAELLTAFTGTQFFPGGMGEFEIKAKNFLVFEEGPSVDMTLQWATYQDASDQCSLSRIWGGIHPPADDIPGRIIGEQIGINAFEFARSYFN